MVPTHATANQSEPDAMRMGPAAQCSIAGAAAIESDIMDDELDPDSSIRALVRASPSNITI
jgi:hypothetical protein